MLRIKELDYLRGFAALGIMFYHYMKWLYIYDGAQSFIGRVSVYGVEIFYILSGITLYHVYQNTLTLKKESLKLYFTKRFFRIFPLFWLSILLTFIISLKFVGIPKLLLNVSGLFAIFAWDKTIALGTWSIGNELVFYLIFPFLMHFIKFNKLTFTILGLLFLFIFNYFAFYIFNPYDTLHNQWANYINPLNHLLLFYIGVCIPFILKQHKIAQLQALSFIVIGAFLLFAFPSGNNGIHLLYGINRWIFSIGSIFICFGFYKLEMNLPSYFDKIFKQLGETSYGIYLLHPFVYQLLCIAIRKHLALGYFFPKSNSLLIAISVTITLITSNFVYNKFEKYFIKKGTAIITNSYKF